MLGWLGRCHFRRQLLDASGGSHLLVNHDFSLHSLLFKSSKVDGLHHLLIDEEQADRCLADYFLYRIRSSIRSFMIVRYFL